MALLRVRKQRLQRALSTLTFTVWIKHIDNETRDQEQQLCFHAPRDQPSRFVVLRTAKPLHSARLQNCPTWIIFVIFVRRWSIGICLEFSALEIERDLIASESGRYIKYRQVYHFRMPITCIGTTFFIYYYLYYYHYCNNVGGSVNLIFFCQTLVCIDTRVGIRNLNICFHLLIPSSELLQIN